MIGFRANSSDPLTVDTGFAIWGVIGGNRICYQAMMRSDAHDITNLLHAWRGGDEDALTEMMPLVYRRLKQIAGHLVLRERRGRALETTELVHEAYLRLADLESIGWHDRAHFFAMCARIMRRVLVDHARAQSSSKRGGRAQRVETAELRRLSSERAPGLVALDDALGELAQYDEQSAQIVELRFFGGLDRQAIAEVLDISSSTVTRRWRSARAWLITYLNGEAA